jgi:AraC-like DNA-binding protein
MPGSYGKDTSRNTTFRAVRKHFIVIVQRTQKAAILLIYGMLHYHEEFELNLIVHAKDAQRIIGDHIDNIDDYELVLVGPNLNQGWFTHECKSTDITEVTIQFHKDLFDDKLLRKNQLRFMRSMFENAANGICSRMTEVSFSRFIKKCTWNTFIDSLNEIRLGHACRMLVNTSHAVSEISYKCGFNNISNFNRIFKKKKGCTPKSFRESLSGVRTFI